MPIKEISNRYITQVGAGLDGLNLCDGNEYLIKDCVIDLSHLSISEIDEAVGITWGSAATLEHCVLRGAGKLLLCGSGDEDKIPLERNKSVTLKECILEDFGRRGPEVQDGMHVRMERCVIRQWGCTDRFTVRSFAAWAHGEGSQIIATNCVFLQHRFWNGRFCQDLINHIGQAYNDSGIKALFTAEAWRPGVARGLYASDGGYVHAYHCYTNHWWIHLPKDDNPMSKESADALVGGLENEFRLKFGLYKD